ncbi:BnaCnng51520D [Brassica napus]|uniref:BnaCnng51520D protein n=1 Tax=Brassica napus TaxID=3708 RepID=A0A078JLA9_BRANA|nr:BnaCnng51520D [Brassica napus]
MAAIARLHLSAKSNPNLPPPRAINLSRDPRIAVSFPRSGSVCSLHTNFSSPNLPIPCAGGGGGGGGNFGNPPSGGGGGGGDGGEEGSSSSSWGPIGMFIEGWRSRVSADPQFPFKVLMEELVGVTACVLGDMASRPNFGLNELDFVFSTLVVGSILNFMLMYLLAPTSATAGVSQRLPGIFRNCPSGHMFEQGGFTVMNRFGTLVYKGMVFATVGLAAGLVGTAISNGLIMLRKKMDPGFETPNKPPPTVLNSLTWATHMGVSANVRYQTLNGVEFLLARAMPPVVFKTSVFVLRCVNNVVGGMSFVLLARMTGSQSVEGKSEVGVEEEKTKTEIHVKVKDV